MVSTLDGRAAGCDGTSESLTSRADRTVLGVIRELSDAVLVGAETLRREPRLVPRRRPLVVVSGSGRLGPAAARSSAPTASPGAAPPMLVVTTSAGARRLAAERPEAEAIVAPVDDSGQVPLTAVMAALRERGLHRIAAEGGPSLGAALVREGLVDELCLTVMPRVGGAALPLFGASDGAAHGSTPPPLSRLRLVRLLADDAGALYGRWSTR